MGDGKLVADRHAEFNAMPAKRRACITRVFTIGYILCLAVTEIPDLGGKAKRI